MGEDEKIYQTDVTNGIYCNDQTVTGPRQLAQERPMTALALPSEEEIACAYRRTSVSLHKRLRSCPEGTKGGDDWRYTEELICLIRADRLAVRAERDREWAIALKMEDHPHDPMWGAGVVKADILVAVKRALEEAVDVACGAIFGLTLCHLSKPDDWKQGTAMAHEAAKHAIRRLIDEGGEGE